MYVLCAVETVRTAEWMFNAKHNNIRSHDMYMFGAPCSVLMCASAGMCWLHVRKILMFKEIAFGENTLQNLNCMGHTLQTHTSSSSGALVHVRMQSFSGLGNWNDGPANSPFLHFNFKCSKIDPVAGCVWFALFHALHRHPSVEHSLSTNKMMEIVPVGRLRQPFMATDEISYARISSADILNYIESNVPVQCKTV